MSATIRATAVVCTHNRRRYLERSLASLLRQSVPEGRYEVVVVDNASTDGTADHLDRVAGRGTHVIRLFEGRLGLSRARNKALASARGEVVAFLDDDAIASENWIERILETFDAGGATVGVLAGRTQPIWEAERPGWLSDRALGALAIVDWAREPGFLGEGQFLVGANMAFRTPLLREVGGFPDHLGRRGASLLSGEETFVARRLAERGYRTFYDPHVVARHHVQHERVDRSWLLRRSYWQGVSNVIAEEQMVRARAVSAAAGAIVRSFGACARALSCLARRDAAGRFDAYMDAARGIGENAAHLGIAPQRPRSEPPRAGELSTVR